MLPNKFGRCAVRPIQSHLDAIMWQWYFYNRELINVLEHLEVLYT
jgi:hypothetical protein